MQVRKFIHATDLHGDLQYGPAVRALKAHVEEFKPDVRIFGGDLWDFAAWRVGADEADRRRRVRKDFRAGMDFLKWFKPHFLTLGNHDVRLFDQVEHSGPMADFCQDLIEKFEALCKANRTRVLPYDKRRGVLKIGKAKFAHGFFDGITAARQMAATYGSVMFGHGHAIDVASVPGADRRAARMVGCLCQLNMKYNRRHVAALRQSHGWGYGYIFPDGSFQQFQAELIGGRVVVADSCRVIPVR